MVDKTSFMLMRDSVIKTAAPHPVTSIDLDTHSWAQDDPGRAGTGQVTGPGVSRFWKSGGCTGGKHMGGMESGVRLLRQQTTGGGKAMKVFLSWSGELSKQVALALRDWLPNVIQAIEPWMSSEDIEKGTRWSSDLAKELATTKAGIVCVTPDNLHAPWLNFEAGALSKVVEKEMVCPFLFRLKYSDLTGPLIQFQLSEATKEDLRKLLSTLNKAVDPKPLSEAKLTEAFDVWWGRLEARLSSISSFVPPVEHTARSADEMIQEVLEIVRGQARTTQELLATIQRNSLVPLSVFSNLNALSSLYGTSLPTRETLLTGSFPKGTNISEYDPPSEDIIGLGGPANDPESPHERDE